jgi:hypothetical protein
MPEFSNLLQRLGLEDQSVDEHPVNQLSLG